MKKKDVIKKVLGMIDEIKNLYDFDYIGIRVSEFPFTKGEILGNSFVWVDGEMTEEELDGTCAIMLQDAILANAYYGDHVAIIGSDSMEYGQDLGEIILRDAEVLEVLS